MVFLKKINDKSLRVVFFLLIINFLADIYGLYSFYTDVSNIISFNVYLALETSFLIIFFFKILISPFVKKVLMFLFAIFLVFWIYEFIKNGKNEFLYNCVIFENISILGLALYYYYEQIIKVNSAFIYVQTRFWVVAAYLVYIAGTFFLLLYIPSLNSKEQVKYYVLNYVFVIIRTMLLSVAMFMKNNTEKQKFKLI